MIQLFIPMYLYSDTIVGNNTIIHSGAVIGKDGFGNIEQQDGRYIKIPQIGML